MLDLLVAGPSGLERTVIADLIAGSDGVHLVGEMDLGGPMLEALAEQSPEVLVIVWPSSEDRPLETFRAVKDQTPATGILMLSTWTDRQAVIEMLNAGADGHVSLMVGEDEFLEAVRAVGSGGRHVCPSCRDPVVEQALEAGRAEAFPEPHDQITGREREVLELVREGLSSCEIAQHLSISPRTIEKHIQAAREKLGLADHQALLHYLLARDL